ncbi:sensor histidine kinase [Kineococcus esterisolvens]|uniref:sensor histidine kinase n=1 Tax=unclassified Kineococcus TaxID=2621656 RepID=UPI003D7C9DE8
MDGAARITSWNAAAEQLYGYRAVEAVGGGLDLIASSAEAQQLSAWLARATTGEGVEAVAAHDVLGRHRDGSAVEVSVTVSPVLDAGGAVVGASIAARDISERRRAEAALRQAEQRFTLAFTHAPAGVLITALTGERAGHFLSANPAACTMLGHSHERLLEMTSADITHPADLPGAQARLQQLLEGSASSAHFEKRYVREDGATIWGAVHLALVHGVEGEPLYAVTHVEDVTRERADRERLAQVNTELAATNAELAEANEALQRVNGELDRFTATVAHDLKSPLTSIAGYAELLADLAEARSHGPRSTQARDPGGPAPSSDGWDGPTPSDPDPGSGSVEVVALEAIGRSTQRMRTLIDGLLSYARARSEALDLQPVHTAAVVDDVVLDLAAVLERTGAIVTRGPLPTVQAHPVLLRQVIANLVGNAVKYVAAGAAPRVQVSARRTAQCWEFAIADNGIGIPAEAREKVFAMFHREAGGDYEGAGIGLATCRRIVDRHGGRLWVSAHHERSDGTRAPGSVFHFTVPVTERAAAPAEAPEPAADGDPAARPSSS